MQNFQRYLTNIRNHYLNIYLDAIAHFKTQCPDGDIEALGNIAAVEGQPEIFRWCRFDMVNQASQPPQIANFKPETHINFEPESLTWQRKLKVRFEPIAWSDVEFECVELNVKKSQLEEWAIRWLDPKDQRPVDNHGLGGRIHAITYPKKKVNKQVFYVDFGSAPIQAFQELLQVILLAGAKKVRVRTSALRAVEAEEA